MTPRTPKTSPRGRDDVKFADIERKFAARNADEAAGGEIVFGVGVGLGPLHVEGAFGASGNGGGHAAEVSRDLARQKKYTGKPARAMPRPMEERRGSRAKVLITTRHSAMMQRSGGQGWPGTR